MNRKIGIVSKMVISTAFTAGITIPVVFASPSSMPPSQTSSPTQLSSTQQQHLSNIISHTGLPKKTGYIDALTATNEQLQEYGIPTRPTDPTQLQHWKNTFGKIKQVIKPQFQSSDLFFSNWENEENISNWGGAINYDNSLSSLNYNSAGYQAVDDYIVVPNLSQHTQLTGQQSAVAQWVGLGGNSGDPNLEQDGIIETSLGNGQYTYQPIWEIFTTNSQDVNYYNVPAQYITNMTVNPGDTLNMETEIVDNGSEVQFLLADETNGQYVDFSEPTYGYVSNDSVEWINEDPMNANTGDYMPFADYGTCNFTGAAFNFGTESDYEEYGPIEYPESDAENYGISTIQQINGNNVTLQTVSEPTISGGGAFGNFTTTWGPGNNW